MRAPNARSASVWKPVAPKLAEGVEPPAEPSTWAVPEAARLRAPARSPVPGRPAEPPPDGLAQGARAARQVAGPVQPGDILVAEWLPIGRITLLKHIS